MSAVPNENRTVAAPVGNPIADAWNDAPDTTAPFEPEYRSPLGATHFDDLSTQSDLEPTEPAEPLSSGAIAIARLPAGIWVSMLMMFAILLVVSTAYDFTTIIPPSGIVGSRK